MPPSELFIALIKAAQELSEFGAAKECSKCIYSLPSLEFSNLSFRLLSFHESSEKLCWMSRNR
jgi:hypothetical protein